MKRFLTLAFLGASLQWSTAESILHPGDSVAICGDSITEQRRYANLIENYLLMCQPQPDLKAMCFGWNGETSWGFLKRVDNDVASFHPEVVTICLGMNDGSESYPEAERYKDYRESMTKIVQILKNSGVRQIIVGTPGVVDTDFYKKSDPAKRNATLGKLATLAKEVASENNVRFADIHTPMLDVMAKAKAKYGPGYSVAGADGVHPEVNGHLIMAYVFLKALGCDGDIGTITYDMGSQQATGSPGQKILSAANQKIEIESTRYPFCFPGDADKPTSTRSIVEFIPFNQELNRYRLVVKNAPGSKVKVTWGKESKVFSSAELAEGINLAAEFLDNPFQEQFSRISTTIRDKEAIDLKMTKSMQHSLLDWKELLPEFSDQYTKMTQRLVIRAKEESAKMSALVTPVKHVIQIEPQT